GEALLEGLDGRRPVLGEDGLGPAAEGGLDDLVREGGLEAARLGDPVLARERVRKAAVERDAAGGEPLEVAVAPVEALELGLDPAGDEGDEPAEPVEGEVAVARDGAVDLALGARLAGEGGVELVGLQGGPAPLVGMAVPVAHKHVEEAVAE